MELQHKDMNQLNTMEPLVRRSEHDIIQRTKNCKIDIFVSSATTLSFIFQSVFLYGYMFFVYEEIRQHKIHLDFNYYSSNGLCPALPTLEVYLHGVAMTSLISFVTIFIMFITSFLPTEIVNQQTDPKLQDEKKFSGGKRLDQKDSSKSKHDEKPFITRKVIAKKSIQGMSHGGSILSCLI